MQSKISNVLTFIIIFYNREQVKLLMKFVNMEYVDLQLSVSQGHLETYQLVSFWVVNWIKV